MLAVANCSMNKPDFRPETIWTGDNLHIMRELNSDSVDLIYLDPPFNSKADYSAPIGSKAVFKDTWTLDELDVEWIREIGARDPKLHGVLNACMADSDKTYLVYISIRLLEMRRVLKPTGSIYLHCDETMSHYLKFAMDAIFGRNLFVNEIIWKRISSHDHSKKFGRTSDRILFYGNRHINTDAVRVPLNPDYVKNFYRYDDPQAYAEWTPPAFLHGPRISGPTRRP